MRAAILHAIIQDGALSSDERCAPLKYLGGGILRARVYVPCNESGRYIEDRGQDELFASRSAGQSAFVD